MGRRDIRAGILVEVAWLRRGCRDPLRGAAAQEGVRTALSRRLSAGGRTEIENIMAFYQGAFCPTPLPP